MTFLPLASKQIWPQVLAVAPLKPEQVFLLHSADANEFPKPARLVPRGDSRREIVHSPSAASSFF